MAVKGVSVPALTVFGLGGLFLWSGIKGHAVTADLRDVIAGKKPSSAQTLPIRGSGGSLGVSGGSSAPPAPVNVSGNVALGKTMAAAYGWGAGSNWNSLYALWVQESGWNNLAKNPDSGAYGIAQALPATKYPLAGQEAGGSHAAAQIAWGLSYIRSRYGNPNGAWAHEKELNWY